MVAVPIKIHWKSAVAAALVVGGGVVFVPAKGFAATPADTADGKVLTVVHPDEGARLPFLKSTFVFGAADPAGSLRINGQAVPIHPGGGYIAMVRLSTGPCLITAELTLGATRYAVERKINVAPPVVPSPVSPLTIESVGPDADADVSPGEEIVVSCKGSPGMAASFRIDKVRGKFPMIETAAGSGAYRGAYIVGPRDALKRSKIKVTLADKKSRKKLTRKTDHTISLFKSAVPVMAEVSSERAILRTAEAGTYTLFLPTGTVLRIVGRRGDNLRVRLNGSRDAWVSRGDVRLLPPGVPSVPVLAGNSTVYGAERSTSVRLPLGRKVPFEVVPDDEGRFIDIFLFGAVSKTDLVVYPSTGAVDQVRWHQDDSETYRLRVHPFDGKWWGYDARYEGSTFVFELRSPPAVLCSTQPLEGITIAVDPGHSPDTGAIGPTALMEKDANLELAGALERKLVAAGAKVVMTRADQEAVPLYDRPEIAFRAGADLLVSIHNNALPDGEDPFKKNGYSVYYYHPLSRLLARNIHDAYGEFFGAGSPPDWSLRDDGLYYNDLAIPRATQMPSVLTESCYIIFPREEALLKSPEFRDRCADAITAGITRYVNAVCKRAQPPRHAKKKMKGKRGRLKRI